MRSATAPSRSRVVVAAAVLLLPVTSCDGQSVQTEPARPSTVRSQASTAPAVPSADGSMTPSEPALCSSIPERTPVASGSVPPPARAVSSRPKWGQPELLSRDRSSLDDGFRADVHVRGGVTTAVWEAHGTASSRVRVIKVADRRVSGDWTRPYVVARRSGDTYGLASASGPRGMVVVVWTEIIGGHDVVVERHRELGRWSVSRQLGRHGSGGGGAAPSVGVDGQGVITVAWNGSVSEPSVDVVSRDAHGRWGTVERVARNAEGGVLAVNRRGDLALTWAALDGVGVALRRHGSTCWATTPLIRSPFHLPEDVGLAVDQRGRALVVWGRALDDGSGRRFLAWSRSRVDGTWSKARYFGGSRPNGVDTLELAMNARGQAVATWTGVYGTQVARLEPGRSRWTRPTKLDRGWPALPVVLADGTAVAVHAARWHFQRPGGSWQRGGTFPEADINEYPMVHGYDRRMSVAYYGDRLTVRLLTPTGLANRRSNQG